MMAAANQQTAASSGRPYRWQPLPVPRWFRRAPQPLAKPSQLDGRTAATMSLAERIAFQLALLVLGPFGPGLRSTPVLYVPYLVGLLVMARLTRSTLAWLAGSTAILAFGFLFAFYDPMGLEPVSVESALLFAAVYATATTTVFLIDRAFTIRFAGGRGGKVDYLRLMVFPVCHTAMWTLMSQVSPYGLWGHPGYLFAPPDSFAQLLIVSGGSVLNFMLSWGASWATDVILKVRYPGAISDAHRRRTAIHLVMDESAADLFTTVTLPSSPTLQQPDIDLAMYHASATVGAAATTLAGPSSFKRRISSSSTGSSGNSFHDVPLTASSSPVLQRFATGESVADVGSEGGPTSTSDLSAAFELERSSESSSSSSASSSSASVLATASHKSNNTSQPASSFPASDSSSFSVGSPITVGVPLLRRTTNITETPSPQPTSVTPLIRRPSKGSSSGNESNTTAPNHPSRGATIRFVAPINPLSPGSSVIETSPKSLHGYRMGLSQAAPAGYRSGYSGGAGSGSGSGSGAFSPISPTFSNIGNAIVVPSLASSAQQQQGSILNNSFAVLGSASNAIAVGIGSSVTCPAIVGSNGANSHPPFQVVSTRTENFTGSIRSPAGLIIGSGSAGSGGGGGSSLHGKDGGMNTHRCAIASNTTACFSDSRHFTSNSQNGTKLQQASSWKDAILRPAWVLALLIAFAMLLGDIRTRTLPSLGQNISRQSHVQPGFDVRCITSHGEQYTLFQGSSRATGMKMKSAVASQQQQEDKDNTTSSSEVNPNLSQYVASNTQNNSVLVRTQTAFRDGAKMVMWSAGAVFVQNANELQSLIDEVTLIALAWKGYVAISARLLSADGGVPEGDPLQTDLAYLIAPDGTIALKSSNSRDPSFIARLFSLDHESDSSILDIQSLKQDATINIAEDSVAEELGKMALLISDQIDHAESALQAAKAESTLILAMDDASFGLARARANLAATVAVTSGAALTLCGGPDAGITGWWDHLGYPRAYAISNKEDQEDIPLYINPPIDRSWTLYAAVGFDWFGWICWVVVLYVLVIILVPEHVMRSHRWLMRWMPPLRETSDAD